MNSNSVQLTDVLGPGEIAPPPGIEFTSAADEEIYRAAAEFERIFVKRMLDEMEKTTKMLGGDDSEGLPGTASTSAYEDMVGDQLATAITDGGGLGLAAVLYGQLNGGVGQ